ncbi:MAG: ATP-binding protein, partial [Rhodospirillaceae bacterium]
LQSHALAKGVAEQADATLFRINAVLSGAVEMILSREDGMTKPDPDIHVYLKRRAAFIPMTRGIIVLDKEGFLLHDSTDPNQRILNLSDRGYFVIHQREPDHGLFVGTPVRGRTTGKWFFPVSLRIEDNQGGFLGIAAAIVDPEHFRTFYASMELGENGEISFYREDGALLAKDPGFEQEMGMTMDEDPVFGRIKAGETEGTDLLDIPVSGSAGVTETWVTSWVADPDWPVVVVVAQNLNGVLGPWYRTLPIYILVGLSASVIILLLVYQIRNHFSRFEEDFALLHRREEELKRAKEASDQANRWKNQFMSNLSEEFRSPLGEMVQGATAVLRSHAEPAQSLSVAEERIAGMVAYAQQSGQSARALIGLLDDVINMAKLDAEGFVPDEEPVRLVELLRFSFAPAMERAQAKGITPDLVCLDEDLWLLADKGALRQSLSNLLSNAIKFTDSGGQITLTGASSETGGVRITVEDTGIGVPDDQIDLIVDPFHQASTQPHSPGKDGMVGIGLGLPIAKAFVTAHGGSLSIESKVGEGTRVIITLPPERVLSDPETLSTLGNA